MAFLSNSELTIILKDDVLADGVFDERRLKNASYELTLGNEAYTNGDDTKTLLDANSNQFEIKPGQFAILMTEEVIKLPNNYIGFISLKFGFKFKGLVNISGFHVDPGFKGKLKFSVLNAGSKSIMLDKGAPYFVLWISQLTSSLTDDEAYNGSHQGQNLITAEDIMKIKGETASPHELLKRITTVQSDLETKIEQMGSKIIIRKDWIKWLLTVIFGISLSIFTKLMWDWGAFQRGYDKALDEISAEKSDRKLIEIEVEKQLKIELDSLSKDTTFINKLLDYEK